MIRPPPDPSCRDLVLFDGTLTIICKGCRNRTSFTSLQASLKFGDDAREADVVRRIRCSGCNRRGRQEPTWFTASFGFPPSAWWTPEQLEDQRKAAEFSGRDRSQFKGVP